MIKAIRRAYRTQMTKFWLAYWEAVFTIEDFAKEMAEARKKGRGGRR